MAAVQIDISRNVHTSGNIASNFGTVINAKTTKYGKAGYPLQFIKSVIQVFTVRFDEKEAFINPPNLLEV